MNILIINDWISNVVPGGTYRIQGFAQGLQELGHKPMICTPFGVVDYDALARRRIHHPQMPSPLYYLTTTMPLLAQFIRSVVKAGIPDLTIIQMPSPHNPKGTTPTVPGTKGARHASSSRLRRPLVERQRPIALRHAVAQARPATSK
jgi:hypothetical protein